MRTDGSTGPDVVDRLVARLGTRPPWTNGLFPRIDLSATAPLADVVATVFLNVFATHLQLGVRF